MRRTVSLVLTGVLLLLPLEAGAAGPTSSYQVNWSVDGATVTLDTSTNMATVSADTMMSVECGGASALAKVNLSGAAAVEVTLERNGRSGSFNGTVELTPVVVFGGCGDYDGPSLTSSFSGSFEAHKGKADRWREGSRRFISRTGDGMFSVHSMVDVAADVTVLEVVSH